MSARGKARKRALDILFEAEIRGEPVIGMLDERVAQASPPVPAYASELVRGVQAYRENIDEVLASNATGWTLERMPAVDRNILRIGAYELLWGSGVPPGVAISEAVLLAQDLSTDASPAFINGLLARLLELRPALLAAAAASDADPDAEPEPAGGTEANAQPQRHSESQPDSEPQPESGSDAGTPPDAHPQHDSGAQSPPEPQVMTGPVVVSQRDSAGN
jgi:transcription antitermination protein NusB